MQHSMSGARRLAGEIRVPGEATAAAEALVLAALAEGRTQLGNVPPGVAPLRKILGDLGVSIQLRKGTAQIDGVGLGGFKAGEGLVDLGAWGRAGLLLFVALGAQTFSSRIRAGALTEPCRQLVPLLEPMGFLLGEEGEGVFAVGGGQNLVGVAHGALEPDLKVAVLLAALCAEGPSSVLAPAKDRDRSERLLRRWGAEVPRQRHGTEGDYRVNAAGGQHLQAQRLQVPGDLQLALPAAVAAACLPGSQVTMPHLRPDGDKRVLVDILRQIGATIEWTDGEDGAVGLTVGSGKLKSTRVAAQRAARIQDQAALLGVLGTQTEGEFVVRDIEALRQGEYDRVAHVVAVLRQLGAQVGEFPEGFVVKGGALLKGCPVTAKDDAQLGMALGVAGLFAAGETVVEDSGGVEKVYPGFFAALGGLVDKKR